MNAVPESKTNLLGLDRQGLAQFVADLGEKPFRARQLMTWLYKRRVDDFEQMTDLSKNFRERLKAIAEIRLPEIMSEHASSDGTRKWLLRAGPAAGDVGGEQAVEMVFIPEPGRGTLCISSQVGCALDCSFCSTGAQGFNRNLSTAEIVGQVWLANRELGVAPDGARAVTNVVLMGMGEPLYNLDNVAAAMDIISDGEGIAISRRRITVSTSGVVPELTRLGETTQAMIAVSLHATNDALRDILVPLNRKYPIEQLLNGIRAYPGLSNARRVTFEYVMLKGVNDTPAEARELLRLIKGIPAKINLIPFNPWPGSPYECSDWKTIEIFASILNRGGYASPIRTPRGRDILAACGQLKSESEKIRASARRAVESTSSD